MLFAASNPIASALIALIVGLAVGWLWRNLRVRELSRELVACRPRVARLLQVEEILAERNGQLAALQTEMGDLREAQARTTAPAPPPQQSELPLGNEPSKPRRKSGSRTSS